MKTVIYARYSPGSKQTEQSIEGQLRVCHEYCARNGLEVIGEYCDRKISGKTDDRPEFQRLIADAKKKKFDAICVYKTDRFARNKYDSAIYKQELRRCGVQIHYAAEAIPDGPEGIILESLMEGLAEYYSAELAQKIRRGMKESALKCQSTGANCPFGFCVGPDKKYQPDPIEAPAVRKIFELYLAGESEAAIQAYLNDRGIKTKRGNAFQKTSVHRILQNRKYIGEYRYSDVHIPRGMPALIEENTFMLVQAEMEKRKARRAPKTPTAEYLLAGKLFCGHCGRGMVGVSGTGKSGNPYFYYYCPTRRKKKTDCEKTHVSRDWLEGCVVDLIQAHIFQQDTLEELAQKVYAAQRLQNDPHEEIAQYKQRILENKKASKNVLQAIENGAVTQTLPARLRELEKERAVLESELQLLQKSQPTFSKDQVLFMLTDFANQRKDETEQAYRKRLISCFVSEVRLWNDKLLIFFNISGPDGKLKSIDREVFDKDDNGSTIKAAGRTRIDVLSYGFVLLFYLPSKS